MFYTFPNSGITIKYKASKDFELASGSF